MKKFRILKIGLLLLMLYMPFESKAVTINLPTNSDPVQTGKSKYTIWLNGISLLGNEVRFSAEKSLPKGFAIEVGAGYKYTQPFTGVLVAEYRFSNYIRLVENALFSEGWHTFAALKYYFPKTGFYLSTNLYFRNRYYHHRLINNRNLGPEASDEDYWDSSQSLNLQTFGVGFMPGYAFEVIPLANNKAIMVDVFTGFSYNYSFAHTEFDWKVNEYTNKAPREKQKLTTAHTENSQFKGLKLNFGFKAGFRF